MAKPRESSELKEGARLVRRILKAIPADQDGREDAVLRKLLEGAAKAADVAAKADDLERPSEE